MTRRRLRRTATAPVVAVVGPPAGLAGLLAVRLADRADLGGLVVLDELPTAEDLAGATTVLHLTSYDEPADVRHTAAVLDTARRAGCSRAVLVTSAHVYGALPGNAVPLPDDAPLRAVADQGVLGLHLEVERLAGSARLQGLDVAVLRPATLVGGRHGAAFDSPMLRQLSAPRLLAARGTEPLWQLCHVEDLLAALELVALSDLTGPLPVACEGWLPQSGVEQVTGKRRIELPASVAVSTAERLHRLGVTTSSPRELDHLIAPVVVGSERLRDAGWTPAWSNDAALRTHLAHQAGADSHAGAYTAAGATVALLGTAALVRRARRRRRGL
jgi:nucleoside-diphosphate-sugar epimerase